MNAVITVTGHDNRGIIAAVSTKCAEYGVNIIDISQSVIRDYFAMIMLADIDSLTVPLAEFISVMEETGKEKGLVIQTIHEDIFNAMHRI